MIGRARNASLLPLRENLMSTRRQNALFLILGVTGLAATVASSRRMSGLTDDEYKFFDEIVEVKHIISSRFVDVPDDKALREGAIQGMVEALNDPYTVYVPASEKKEFNKDLTGEYVGIGAQVNVQDGWLTIVSPLEDSPAFRVGLMADDRVTTIAGTSTQNKSVNDCVDLLMGEPGSTVKLGIERKGQKLEVEITREKIKTRSVKGIHRLEGDSSNWEYVIDRANGIAYVRLTQFTPKCAEEVRAALVAAGAENGSLKGLVLDLRYNPGGLLNEAEAIADLFLDEGVIVSTKGRAYAEKITRAEKPGTLPQFPIAVLLNGSSASASEVLSGALVENKRCIVVGTRSYGKGSVQSVMELPSGNGSELKITEQGYFLPSGRSISRKDGADHWGVDPSDGFYVPMTDAQTTAMLEARRREEVLRYAKEQGKPAAAQAEAATPVDWNNLDSVLSHLKDPQLAAAVKAVQLRLSKGEWVPTGETHNAAAKIAGAELVKLNQYQQRLLRELARTERRIDAIQTAAADEAPKPVDFWANDLDLTGGMLEIRDKDGKVITRLDITGNNLERWLLDADVKKHEEIVK
jgi:carboxyl-terminal processing protease